MNEPNIVILAGGISSRMKKMPDNTNGIEPQLLKDALEKSKAMIGVGNNTRPFLDYLLNYVERAGYRHVVIVVGERDDSIRRYYDLNGKNQFPLLDISYATQTIPTGRTKPLGTADALLAALRSKPEWKEQSFTVCNSDNLYSVNALQLLLKETHANALIDYDRAALRFDEERILGFAVIKKDEQGFLTDIVEKPTAEEINQAEDSSGRIGVSMNIFRLTYEDILPFLETIPLHPVRNEKELPVAVKMLAQSQPKSVWTIPLAEHVIDLTNQSDIPIVKEYLQKHFLS
ncbi:MAG: NTP transferase domain-containing protein [Ignavibacteriae bacterium]|nr:NTP transferase domain-containing protein [Ignavibacteriota bacterium]